MFEHLFIERENTCISLEWLERLASLVQIPHLHEASFKLPIRCDILEFHVMIFKKKKLIIHVIIYSAEGETFKNCRWNRRSFGIKEIFATWNGFWTSEDHFLFSLWLIQLNDISCRVVPPEFSIKCNQQNLLFHQAEALVKIYAFSWKSQWYWLSCGSLDQIPRFIF